MNSLIIEANVFLTRYEREYGNASQTHIAVVAKMQRAPSAQGKRITVFELWATLQAHR